MPHYEMMYILRPELGDAEVEEQMGRFAQIAADNGARVTKHRIWEKRRLVYDIKGVKEGTFILMNVEAARNTVADLGRQLRLAEPVVRHMIVLAEGEPEPEPAQGEENVQPSDTSRPDGE